MRTRKIAVLSFAALVMLPQFFYPQARQKSADDQVIKLKSELVTVDTQVLSRKTGIAINALTKRDFTIYEDGVKQYVETFSQDKLPLSIVLLLDVSGSVQPIIDQVSDHGLEALSQLRPQDEVAVMAFGVWATVIQEFTTDRESVIKEIRFIKSMGTWIREHTYIDEAVYQAAAYLRKASNPDSRRCIIAITDNLTNQPEGVPHSQSEAIQELLENGSVLSCLLVGDYDAVATEYRKHGQYVVDRMSRYASETGGAMVPASSANASTKLAQVIERLRTRYSLGYFSTNQARDGRFRKIAVALSPDVEKREGRIAVVTRKGYYAPKNKKTAWVFIKNSGVGDER
jgi:VWFA-related protein